tara:strand:+ start:2492 stop:3514 length:1023 start_codon:yes stop_codon:yes gene_type:complete
VPNFEEKFPKICFVKTAWSEEYQGENVYGRHGYIERHGDGSERYNFKPGPDGKYFGYIPPHKTPKDAEGWLVIIVAASTSNNGRTFGPLNPVGWYENARFVEDQQRPEYKIDSSFPKSLEGDPYIYNMVSDQAFIIPTELRNLPLPKEHGRKLGMASRVEVKSNDPKTQLDQWRIDYTKYAIDLLSQLRPDEGFEVLGPGEKAVAGNFFAEAPTNHGYASSEHRRTVELAAEKFAKHRFQKHFYIKDVTKDNLGYDFHLNEKNGSRQILLEIKGTSGSRPMFYLTRNELKCLRKNVSDFHLFLVTNTLSKAPLGHLFTASEIEDRFDLEPLSYQAIPKKK